MQPGHPLKLSSREKNERTSNFCDKSMVYISVIIPHLLHIESKLTTHGTKPLELQGGQVGLEKLTKNILFLRKDYMNKNKFVELYSKTA